MSNNSSAGAGIAEVLLIVFVILKLCGVITWPWVWVLSPFWISLTLAAIGLIVLWIIKKLI